ncbi:MAG: hypothetical protein PHU43_09125 [Candidatus Bipolaricaulis sp.]|nr:hypothetical protein [Candidatus Bipolaricaulis sp.]
MPLRWILPVGLALLGLLFVVSSLRDGVRSAAGPAPADVDPLRGLAELLFRAFVEESYRRLELRDPDTLISNELAQVYGVEERGRWSHRSPDYLEETYALERRTLAMPYARDREALGPEERSTDDVYERYLADRVRWHSFTNVDYCSTPYDLQSAVLGFLILLPIESAADAEAYAERLSAFGMWKDQVLEGSASARSQGPSAADSSSGGSGGDRAVRAGGRSGRATSRALAVVSRSTIGLGEAGSPSRRSNAGLPSPSARSLGWSSRPSPASEAVSPSCRTAPMTP